MKHSPNELIMALKRVYVLIRRDGLTFEEFRDLRDCVQIAYENGAWRNNPEVIYKTVGDPRRIYRNQNDALADIDAGVDDVFDKLEDEQ